MSKKAGAYISLLLTFLLWGSIYVASSYATDVFSPAVVACGRYIAGTAFLFILIRKMDKPRIAREDIKYFAIIAVLGYYGTITLNTIGIKLAGPAVSSVLNSLMPVGISLAAAVMLKERLHPVGIMCIGLALIGTVIVMGGSGHTSIAGALSMIGGIVTWSIATIYIKKMSVKYPPELLTAYAMGMSLLVNIPVAAVDIIHSGIRFELGAAAAVLYMGVFTTGVAQYLWSRSLSVLNAGVCSMFYPLQPVFSVILGRLFLREELRPGFFLGAGLIALTVIINCLWNERQHILKK